jgi:hypothetical protein
MLKVLNIVERKLAQDIKSTSRVERTSVIDIDDGQPASYMPYVNAVLYTGASSAGKDLPQKDRWILNPRSNCYVTNTRGANWIPLKRGRMLDVVCAGGVYTQVKEWGTTTINAKTLTGEGKMKLT